MAPLTRLTHRAYSFEENPFFEAPLHESTPYIPYISPRPSKTYLDIKASPSSAAPRVKDPYQPIIQVRKGSPLFLTLLVAISSRATFTGCALAFPVVWDHQTNRIRRYSASKTSTCQKTH